MIVISEDNLCAVIIKRSLALLAVLTIAGFAFFSVKTGLGVLAGGVASIVNFLWMRNILQRILGLKPENAMSYALLRFLARMTVLGVTIYIILTSGWFSVAGLLAGLSIIVANIIFLSICSALHTGG